MPTVFPCTSRVLCDTDNPLQNLSTEAPDHPVAISVFFPTRPVPLGRTFTASGCTGVCTSPISQEDADLCAARLAVGCTLTPPPNNPPPPPPVCVTPGGCLFNPPENPPPNNPPPPTGIPCNTAQVCCVNCPDGSQFCYTVPACSFFAGSIEEANAVAYSYACKQAAFSLLCIAGTLPEACVGEDYSGQLTAAGGVTTVHDWQIISGALPAGLVLSTNATGSILFITGIPTTPGISTFTFRVVDGLGNFMIRTFTILTFQITSGTPPSGNVDVPYSFQFTAIGGNGNFVWSVMSGQLPHGLTLTPEGLLSGTPTTSESQSFKVCVSGF